MNSTFLALVPKKDNSESFMDYKPIALCNLVYKLVTKIIVMRLKLKLFEVLSKEQCGFLKNRQILEAIGISQEFMHSAKVKKMRPLLMKIDLAKEYDKVDWGFLHLVLLQIGLFVEVTNWIMACVSSTNFAILINGAPTSFFNSSIGLHQQCPLSLLLFLLIIEGLSKMVLEAKIMGKFEGLKIASTLQISHLISVDDVILGLKNRIYIQYLIFLDKIIFLGEKKWHMKTS